MKIKLWIDSGANIKSCKEIIRTPEQLGFTLSEWDSLSDEEKDNEAYEWALEQMEYGFEEIE